MATDTFNFPCWATSDKGPDNLPRGDAGMVFETGPGAFRAPAPMPFTESITYVFSFLARSGWTANGSLLQYIASMGLTGIDFIRLYVIMDAGGDPQLRLVVNDGDATTIRYQIQLGDEDGSNWLSFDKWYQVVLTWDSSGIDWAVNGSLTPKFNVTTNTPGALNMDFDVPRIWLYGGPTSATHNPDLLASGWPSFVAGVGAMRDVTIDLTDSAVMDRIYDSNGDFKNPGENGSLWFGDTYDATVPESYFMDGSARFSDGDGTMAWGSDEGASEWVGHPGGLRKQYE